MKDNFTTETLHQIQSCCMCKQISICIWSDLHCRLLTEVFRPLLFIKFIRHTEYSACKQIYGRTRKNWFLSLKHMWSFYLKAVFHPITYWQLSNGVESPDEESNETPYSGKNMSGNDGDERIVFTVGNSDETVFTVCSRLHRIPTCGRLLDCTNR